MNKKKSCVNHRCRAFVLGWVRECPALSPIKHSWSLRWGSDLFCLCVYSFLQSHVSSILCAFLSLRGFGPGHSRLLVCLGLVFQLFPFVGPWAYGLRAHWLTVMRPLDTVGNMCSCEGGQAWGGCGYSLCLGGLKACICVVRAWPGRGRVQCVIVIGG